MFIIKSTYIKPLSDVNHVLEAHIHYLDKFYALNKFICSGRQNPRTGGIILCNADTLEEVEETIHQDPFYIHQMAEYEIIEFLPTKYANGFEQFLPHITL